MTLTDEPVSYNDSILHATSGTDRISKTGSYSNTSASGPSTTASNGLNPRSCVTCRRRKVRCDKKHPCTNCHKAHIECVFPAPGRAPRKPRKPQDGELMERLRRLEGVVQSLGVVVHDDEQSLDGDKSEDEDDPERETAEEELMRKIREVKELKRKNMEKMGEDNGVKMVESRFGRLVVDEGRSRYINPSFWASLSDEVEDLKGLLNEDSEEEGTYPSPESSDKISNTQGYIFGHNAKSVDMLALHPPAEHVPKYWELFKERVDPLVKILHLPTIEPTVLEARHRLDGIHRGLEALMFAIYYGAVTTIPNEHVRSLFGEEKLDLVMRYKFGCEQALARADFLQTDEVIVLQAYVIFLMCSRRNDDARIIWTLSGLVVRMAQTLGIHRDGGHYNLPPFDVEMRRRLWWQICLLDSRASEDHGCDPTITEQSFDTQMPLNVNDADLSPDMKTFPEPRLGCTEMTFGLIRFEIVSVLRRIQYVPPGPKTCNSYFATVTLEKKEEWISECHARIEERYLKHCDMSVPLYWVVATVARLIMSKMWLMIYHPFQRQDGGNSLPQETKDKLFLTSLENIEYSLLLENESRTRKWGWLFQTYVQWHAIAFLLNELCVRTDGQYVERAWRAIEIVTSRRWGAEYANNKLKSHLWRPLRRLMEKARSARQTKLAEIAKQQNGNGLHHSPADVGADIGFAAPYMFNVPPHSNMPTPKSATGSTGKDASIASSVTSLPLIGNLDVLPEGHGSPFRQNSLPLSDPNTPSFFSSGSAHESTASSSLTPEGTTSGVLGQLPQESLLSAAGNGQQGGVQSDVSLDWFLNDPNLQVSPSQGQFDESMIDDSLNWTNWDDMVMQFGANGEMEAAQQGIATSGQLGGFGGASGMNQWY